MKVLVTGATGFIGKHLINALLDLDYDVTVVSRDSIAAHSVFPSGIRIIEWEGSDLLASVKSSQAIINLAGESIARFPWNSERKRAIMNSRLLASQRLHHVLSVLGNWNGVFIQASATGFYGIQPEMECSELCVAGNGFLANVCSKWESQVQELESIAGRVITIRIGVVFGKEDGIFPQLLRNARMHIGGRLGKGDQWVSWIHVYDLVYGIIFLLNDETAKGIFNLVAPHPVKQKALSAMIRETAGTGFQFKAPAFMIRLLFGEFGRELLLGGQKASAGKMIRQGFVYKFPDTRQALSDMFDPYQS